MTFAPALQSFVSADTSTANSSQAVLDWVNGKVFPYHSGGGVATRFNFTSGAEESVGSLSGFASPLAVDGLGSLYVKHDLMNFTGVSQYSPSFLLTATWGASSGSNNEPNGIPLPGNFATVQTSDSQWLVTAGQIPIGGDQHAISVVKVGALLGFGGHHFAMQGGSWSNCYAGQSASLSTVFTLAGPTSLVTTPIAVELYRTDIRAGAASYNPLTWPVQNSFIASSLIGSVVPTAIDSSWSHIFQNGIVYDATDGNAVVSLITTDSVTHPSYIAKLRASDATVLWKVAIPNLQFQNLSQQFGLGQIRTGQLAIFVTVSGTPTVFLVDTATGASSSFTTGLAGVAMGSQCFNDTLGCIVGYTTFSQTAGSPELLNSTPTSFSGWAALYVTPPFTPPPIVRVRNWGTYYTANGQ